MSELVDFLRARLDEDATEIAKHPDGEDDWEFMATGEFNYPCTPYLMIGKKRALAEVEAKRKIVGAWQAYDDASPVDDHAAAVIDGAKRAVGCVLRELAQPYSDHRDYRQEWAP